jgi:hypothetical protein
MARDHHHHDFAGAFGDAVAALLTPELLDRQIGGERDAAVHLHAFVGGAERHLVGVIFGDVAILARVLPGIETGRRLVDQKPRGLQLDIHVRELPLDRLAVGQQAAEGRALLA